LQEAQAALKAAADKAKASKKVVIAKSLVLFDVKPYDEETNLDDLAQKIFKIEKDGLFWKTEYKKETIAYTIQKLIVGCVIEDDKISTDWLQEQIEGFDEEVQSVDIAAFSKI